MSSADITLLTLPPSHYCERARWALDRQKIKYNEKPLGVGYHAIVARRIAISTALPILITGGQVIQGSGAILSWAQLCGGDHQLEQRFEETVGVLVRQYLYAATLSNSNSQLCDTLLAGVPPLQVALGKALWPLMRPLMIRSMNARPRLLGALKEKLDSELDWFENRLRGAPYLVGNRFGRADITAASLLAPLARPQACPLYRQVILPDAIEGTLSHWAQREALQWVNTMYDKERKQDKLVDAFASKRSSKARTRSRPV
jgi:glutathione S-transferase